MSTRTDLYGAFENYDKPTEDDFRGLIDFAGVPVSFQSVNVTPVSDIVTDMNNQTFIVNVRLIYIIYYGNYLYMFSALEGTYGLGGTTIAAEDLVDITTTTVSAVHNSSITLSNGAGIDEIGSFTLNQSSDSAFTISVDSSVLRTTGNFNPGGNFNFTGSLLYNFNEVATEAWVNDQGFLTSDDVSESGEVPSWVAQNQSSVLLANFGGQLDASRIDNLPESTDPDELEFAAVELHHTQSPTVTGSYPNYTIGIPQGVPGEAGPKGEAGAPGAPGTHIIGKDTVANILAKVNPQPGDAWIATDTGFDQDGNAVRIDDALTYSLGTWTNIGPWRGPSDITRTSQLINDGADPNDGLEYVLEGDTTFLVLPDTPNSYVGYGGNYIRVKSDNSGLEYAPSVSTPTHIHNQTTAQAVWSITHSLAKIPSVTILDDNNDEVKADVNIPDISTVIITFGADYTGSAILN